MVATFIGLKAFVAGLLSLLGNLTAQPSGVQGILAILEPGEEGILAILEPGEVRGTSGVGVKSCNPRGTTCGEGASPERLRQ